MGYKEIQIVKNPKYLVITPLRPTDCITEYLDASIDLNSYQYYLHYRLIPVIYL